jgi:hypothetical protein
MASIVRVGLFAASIVLFSIQAYAGNNPEGYYAPPQTITCDNHNNCVAKDAEGKPYRYSAYFLKYSYGLLKNVSATYTFCGGATLAGDSGPIPDKLNQSPQWRYCQNGSEASVLTNYPYTIIAYRKVHMPLPKWKPAGDGSLFCDSKNAVDCPFTNVPF